jgi:hypothetical protein
MGKNIVKREKVPNFSGNSLVKSLFCLTLVILHLEFLNVVGKKRHNAERVSPVDDPTLMIDFAKKLSPYSSRIGEDIPKLRKGKDASTIP